MAKEHSNLPIENSKKDELKPASLVRYENMSNELLELYKRKNADYGDSITNKICPTFLGTMVIKNLEINVSL